MKTNKKKLRLAAAAGALLLAACAAQADWRPDGFVAEAGPGKDGVIAAGGGLLWDWDWRHEGRAVLLTAHTELLLQGWRHDAIGGGHDTLAQAVLLPTLRVNFSQGRSPWYLELGIGASYTSDHYRTPERQFSTRWNFHDVLGVGYRFGAGGRQEIGLRYTHVSNGGVRKPNPGEDFIQLRYVQRF